MKKNRGKILLLVLFLYSSFLCSGRENNRNIMRLTDKKIYKMREISSKEKKKFVSQIPMTKRCEVPLIIEKYTTKDGCEYTSPYITLYLNGSKLQFMFDTGTVFSCISDNALKKIGIAVDESIEEACCIFVKRYALDGNNMGGFVFEYTPGYTYGADVNGTETDGLLGLDFVAGAVSFCIDYAGDKLILNDNPNEYKDFEKIPMTVFSDEYGGKVRIHITVDGKDYSAVPDSGADRIISCKKILNLPIKRLEWTSRYTVNGIETVKNYFAEASEIRIGSTVINNHEIMLWDDYALEYFSVWRNAFKFYDVFLGVNGFFDRYKVWVSLEDKCLYIKPYDSAFE